MKDPASDEQSSLPDKATTKADDEEHSNSKLTTKGLRFCKA